MANYEISSSGTTNVPLGGTATLTIFSKVSGMDEDVDSVQVVLKNHLGATISDETYTSSNVSASATDGGAITITNPAGTGNYQWTYAVPNDGTYNPPAGGNQFTVTVTITEGGDTGTESVTFDLVQPDVVVSFDAQAILGIVKRRTGLLRNKLIVAEGSETTLDLGQGIVYSIDSAFKNGTAIVGGGTDYTWSTYRTNVTLTVAATANDHYVFRLLTRMSETDITDFINESQDFIVAKLRCLYDDESLPNYETVKALIAARAIGYIKEELQEGIALEGAKYRSGRELIDETTKMCNAIAKGEVCIIDDEGNVLDPTSGSFAAGYKDPKGVVAGRLDMVDRAQRWTALLHDFYPETASEDVVDTRSL